MDPKGKNMYGKNVYISGPITGKPLHNAPAFAEAHAMLREIGAREVFDPLREWLEDAGPEPAHEDCMLGCVRQLVRPATATPGVYWDAIVMLDGFGDSDGAQVELAVAEAIGLDVLTVADLREAWEARNE